MAITLTGWGNAKVWEKMLWTEANDELWWKNWISDDKSNIIERNTDLTKNKGDQIVFGLLPRITDTGKTNDNDMEGSEQDLTFFGDSVTITQYKQAVINTGNYKSQIIPFEDLYAMKEALKVWAAERLDGLFFSAMNKAGWNQTNNVLTVGTTKYTQASMTLSANELLLADIRKLPYFARQRRINPLRIGGKNYYVLLMHDDAAARLMSVDPANVQSWYQTMLHGCCMPRSVVTTTRCFRVQWVLWVRRMRALSCTRTTTPTYTAPRQDRRVRACCLAHRLVSTDLPHLPTGHRNSSSTTRRSVSRRSSWWVSNVPPSVLVPLWRNTGRCQYDTSHHN
jgi:hypothetical protein